MRKAALDSILLVEPELTPEEIKKLAGKAAEPGVDGMYSPGFPSMFTYLFMRN
jgi:hypothetical protein